jgi:NhaP-type Na+/H+ and K+/H+ antiporter
MVLLRHHIQSSISIYTQTRLCEYHTLMPRMNVCENHVEPSVSWESVNGVMQESNWRMEKKATERKTMNWMIGANVVRSAKQIHVQSAFVRVAGSNP